MALIQSVGLSSAVSSSATISSSQVGSTIIVLVGTSGLAPTSVTDNLGTTYTKLTVDTTQYCFYGQPATGGVTTITINNFVNGTAFINEESGLVSNPLDSISIGYNNSSGGTTWITNGVNVGTSSGVGYVFTQYLGGPGMTGFGVDSPWTILSGTGITGGTVTNSGYGSQSGAGRRTISAPGTYSGTGFTGTTWYPFTYVVFFKYVDTPRTKFIDPTLVNTTGISTGTWTKYNLNGIVQPGATGAMFSVIRSGAGAQVVNLRKFGSTDNYTTITLSGSSQNFLICGLDSSLQFELYTNDTNIQLYCIGYFNAEATFFTNAQGLTPTLTYSWTDYDISSYVPSNAKAAIVTTNLNSYNVSVRVKGSTDTFANGNEGQNKKYLIVGLDSNKKFQAVGYPNARCNLLLVGYITDGIVWNTNAIQRTISSNNKFTLLPTSATAAGYLYHLNSPSGGPTSLSCTLRKSGNYSYDPNTYYIAGSTQVSVGPFPEFKTANTADQNVYELGYFVSPGMRMHANLSTTTTSGGPVVTSTDNFNRSDTTASNLGGNWGTYTGLSQGGQILSNKASAVATFSCRNYYNVTLTNDQWAQATVANTNYGGIGLILRSNPSTAAGYFVDFWQQPAGGIEIYYRQDSTTTTLIANTAYDAANTVALGDIIKADVVGTKITAYVNGIEKLNVSNTTLTSGNPGLFLDASGGLPATDATVDDYSVGNVVATTSSTVTYGPAVKITNIVESPFFVGNNSSLLTRTQSIPQAGSGQTYATGGLSWFTNGYVATVSGPVDKAYVNLASWMSSTAAKIIVYDSNKNKLGIATLTSSQGTGLIGASFDTQFNVVAGQTYYIAITGSNVYLTVYQGNVDYVCTGIDSPYASIPTTLPTGLSAGQGELFMYITVLGQKLYANGTFVCPQFVEQA